MLASFQRVRRFDPGFSPDRLLTMRLAIPESARDAGRDIDLISVVNPNEFHVRPVWEGRMPFQQRAECTNPLRIDPIDEQRAMRIAGGACRDMDGLSVDFEREIHHPVGAVGRPERD